MSDEICISGTYRGYPIKWDDGALCCNELNLRAGNPPDLKRKIDAALKEEFTRFKALQVENLSGKSPARTVEVTSFAGFCGYGDKPHFWIVTSEGRREKEEASQLLTMTAKNQKAMSEYVRLNEEASIKHKEADGILAACERIPVPVRQSPEGVPHK